MQTTYQLSFSSCEHLHTYSMPSLQYTLALVAVIKTIGTAIYTWMVTLVHIKHGFIQDLNTISGNSYHSNFFH